ncbi:MAG: DNA-binding response OmpR family regulator [Lysobacterales bacterium]|jgi:DNA-binding response OmpR family regulator
MGKKIVVVDDALDVIKLLSIILEKEGYEVRTSQDGAEGYDLILNSNPDVILLDQQLPGKTGVDICKELRLIDHFKDTPIYFISGSEAVELDVLIEEGGATGSIPKPFNIDQLKETIAQAVR